jgi:hypothetical protein
MFKVAIPSYKRSDVIMDKTLGTLRRGGVALSDIYIFVVDDEKESYQRTCPGYQIIVGLRGKVEQISFIQGFFAFDTNIVMIDDDITQIYKPLTEKTKEEILDLPSLFCRMILRMGIERVTICGCYPVDNIKFAFNNPEVTTDFRYLIGVLTIIKNKKDPGLLVDSADILHEDKIRTLKYYQKEGKTLRFNHICFKTSYFAKGGICSAVEDRFKKHSEQSEELCKKYPDFFRIKKTRSSKVVDIAFKKQNSHERSSSS